MKTICILLLLGSAACFQQGVVFERGGDVLLTDSCWTVALQYNLTALELENGNLTVSLLRVKGEYDTFFQDLQAQNISPHSPVYELEAGFRYEYASLQQLVVDYVDKTGDLVTLLPHTRQKRGLVNLGGHVLKFLFGTLDSNDLETIDTKLDSMARVNDEIVHNAEEQLTNLGNMQTELTTHAKTINQVILTLREYHQEMHQTMVRNFAREVIALNQLKILFKYLKLNSALSEIKDTVTLAIQRMTKLHQAVEDLAAGRMTSNLLPPHQYLEVLRSVEAVVPPPSKLFLDVTLENLHDFYKNAHVQAYATRTQLRVLIKLPLKNDDKVYETFNVIPYPIFDYTLKRWVSWDLKNHKLMISKDRQTYTVYESEDFFRECAIGKLTICPLTNVILNVHKRPNCAIELFLGNTMSLCSRKLTTGLESPVLIRTPIRWLYTTSEESRVVLNCFIKGASPEVSTIVLKGVGEIPNRNRCDLIGEGYKVPARFTGSSWYAGDFGKLIFPDISSVFTEEETGLLRQDLNATLKVLQGLDDQLGTLRVKEYSLESTIHYLRSHHENTKTRYLMLTLSTVMVIVFIVVVLLYRWRTEAAILLCARLTRSRQRRSSAPTGMPFSSYERGTPLPEVPNPAFEPHESSSALSPPPTGEPPYLTILRK